LQRIRDTSHSLAQRARLILLLAEIMALLDIMAKLDLTAHSNPRETQVLI